MYQLFFHPIRPLTVWSRHNNGGGREIEADSRQISLKKEIEGGVEGE